HDGSETSMLCYVYETNEKWSRAPQDRAETCGCTGRESGKTCNATTVAERARGARTTRPVDADGVWTTTCTPRRTRSSGRWLPTSLELPHAGRKGNQVRASSQRRTGPATTVIFSLSLVPWQICGWCL